MGHPPGVSHLGHKISPSQLQPSLKHVALYEQGPPDG